MEKEKQYLGKETIETIILAKQILQIFRIMKKEKQEKTKHRTAYEEALRINPYLSKYNTTIYYSY